LSTLLVHNYIDKGQKRRHGWTNTGGVFYNLEQHSTSGYYLITFPSVQARNGPLVFQLIPVPREISSSCGVAAKVQHITKEELFYSYSGNTSYHFQQFTFVPTTAFLNHSAYF